MDVMGKLTNQYKYSYATKTELTDMGNLIKMVFLKHSGSNHPSSKNIKKVPDTILPERKIDNNLNS